MQSNTTDGVRLPRVNGGNLSDMWPCCGWCCSIAILFVFGNQVCFFVNPVHFANPVHFLPIWLPLVPISKANLIGKETNWIAKNAQYHVVSMDLQLWPHLFWLERFPPLCLQWLESDCNSMEYYKSILHFRKVTWEHEEEWLLGQQIGYRWIRLDPRNTPGWTHRSGTGSRKTGKTGSRPFYVILAELGHLQTW